MQLLEKPCPKWLPPAGNDEQNGAKQTAEQCGHQRPLAVDEPVPQHPDGTELPCTSEQRGQIGLDLLGFVEGPAFRRIDANQAILEGDRAAIVDQALGRDSRQLAARQLRKQLAAVGAEPDTPALRVRPDRPLRRAATSIRPEWSWWPTTTSSRCR